MNRSITTEVSLPFYEAIQRTASHVGLPPADYFAHCAQVGFDLIGEHTEMYGREALIDDIVARACADKCLDMF